MPARCLSSILVTALAATAGAAAQTAPTTTPRTRPATSQPTAQPAESENPPAPGFDADGSDPRAMEIADSVMKKMGGREAWDRIRYLSWNFFGSRRHVWDKHTGNIRIEDAAATGGTPSFVILMNIHTKQGRAWAEGVEISDSTQRDEMLENGLSWWINDSYWLVMPYKLKDSGVTLKSLGRKAMEDGRPAEVLELRFKDVGRTPQNKYHVYVAVSTGLVEQWDFFGDAADEQPRFSTPWAGWTPYGRILLSGDRGVLQDRPAKLTDIAVADEVPVSTFRWPGGEQP